jgi:hypothetical protein
MKVIPLLLCLSQSWLQMSAQSVAVGVKGGLPVTQTSDEGREAGRYGGQTQFQLKRYTLGPTIEIGLPWHFRIEADAMYKHARQDRFAGPAPYAVLTQEGARVNIWEVPLLLKYRVQRGAWRPFAVAGANLRHVGDLSVDVISKIPVYDPLVGIGGNYLELRQSLTYPGDSLRYGISLGGGLSRKLGPLRIEPELRYTHWTAHRWMATTEQLEILIGLTFPFGR